MSSDIDSHPKRKLIWLVAGTAGGLLVLATAAGIGLGVGYARGRRAGGDGEKQLARTEEKKVKFWTCSMHPQIHLPDKGICPLCPMDLIPVYVGGGDEGGPRRLSMSAASEALAEVVTAEVERKFVATEVRMVGKIDYDETRVKHITAWFPGRLDRMYVDYTGIAVRKGDHLVRIYSPELLAAQEELIQAKQTFTRAGQGSSEFMRRSSKATLSAAREKLRLWGLSKTQVEKVEKSGKTRDHMTIYSPKSGIVIKKHLNQGAYVKTGSRIYTVADLSRVWVQLDAYESDLEWLRYGQQVSFGTEAYAGEVFRGSITFINPVLDSRTRTVKVRIIAENKRGKLKPGMFVRAVVRPVVAAAGKVMDPRLAGKWISPMHPEVIKDGPGKCDVCDMDLVKAEDLGYLTAAKAQAPLVIPVSAPLITGKRAVVYVKVPNTTRPTFEGREVVLGPRAGDYYIVRKGLKAGERVVARGAFKIDSALQIEAKPSMMSPSGGVAGGGAHAGHGGAGSGSKGSGTKTAKPSPQTTCPVMGGKINRKHYADHKGKRVYFCCPGCDATFKKDPEKYLKKFRDSGVKLEDVPTPKKSGGYHGH